MTRRAPIPEEILFSLSKSRTPARLSGRLSFPTGRQLPPQSDQETIMTPRLSPFAAAPKSMKAFLEFGAALGGVETSLAELVKMRASQINGCGFCLHMHARDARKHGEIEERLHLLAAWRESPLFTDRERAALAWTEALTLVAQTRAPDDDYQALKLHFTEQEQVDLTLLIVAINGWNRINVGFRTVHPVAARAAA
jgi:AhpD family alkylhydroperoxidase